MNHNPWIVFHHNLWWSKKYENFYENDENKLTPGRYRVPKFGQTKKNDVIVIHFG